MLRYYDKDVFRVISIDPGTNCCGFSVIEIDFETKTPKVIESVTVKGSNLIKRRKAMVETFSEKDAKLHGYADYLRTLLIRWSPDFVCSESPYLGRFAAAYGALKEQLMVFRLVCWQYDRRMEFLMIEPSPVKKHMKVNGKSGDKDLMTKALAARKDLEYGTVVNPEVLDEHEIDSICVGLYFIDRITEAIFP